MILRARSPAACGGDTLPTRRCCQLDKVQSLLHDCQDDLATSRQLHEHLGRWQVSRLLVVVTHRVAVCWCTAWHGMPQRRNSTLPSVKPPPLGPQPKHRRRSHRGLHSHRPRGQGRAHQAVTATVPRRPRRPLHASRSWSGLWRCSRLVLTMPTNKSLSWCAWCCCCGVCLSVGRKRAGQLTCRVCGWLLRVPPACRA